MTINTQDASQMLDAFDMDAMRQIANAAEARMGWLQKMAQVEDDGDPHWEDAERFENLRNAIYELMFGEEH